MKEPRYVPIYCATFAQDQAKHLIAHPEMLGRCFAERVEGLWTCCCCGERVSVVW